MKRIFDRYLLLILWLFMWMAMPVRVGAQEVVGVLSSDLGPYQEAYEGFREAFGQEVPRISLASGSPEIGRDTRVVVAFGGKAALYGYPEGVSVIYCLAPAARLEASGSEVMVKVHMLPYAGYVVSKVKEIQPGLRRLGVFWASDAMSEYVGEISRASVAFGLEVAAERVGDPDELPDRLRGLLRRGVDGLWLPPDPLLINSRSFALLREFCRSNDIPFYVPTAGLVEKGAVASISASFREIGRTAGRVARRVLSGEHVPRAVYPEVVEVTLNLSAASEVGLEIPPAVSAQADRVLP